LVSPGSIAEVGVGAQGRGPRYNGGSRRFQLCFRYGSRRLPDGVAAAILVRISTMAEALLGLGGNIGEVRRNLDRAVELLCEDGRAKVVAQSSDFRTPPWGVEDQPAYINRCVILETDLGPRALLERALAVERALGRDRSRERRWGPRPIDIDLLSYDDMVVAEPGLTLPHPHWAERAFVLVPLAEIAADRVIGGVSVSNALARVDASGIERLPPASAQ
jgi:2-amino-4-hydroxy-6-hydroxymethyldihydropteridine diphosphokinase